MAERAKKEAELGRKLTGPKPSADTARRARPRRANTTDPHSRIIATGSRGVLQGYNAQAAATADQVVLAAEVTVTTKSGLVRAHANATDPAAAVDQVVDRLERQVKKLKGRQVDRTQHADGVKAIPPLPPEGVGEAQGATQPAGHDEDAPVDGDETDQAKVVYRRPHGDAGANEPEP